MSEAVMGWPVGAKPPAELAEISTVIANLLSDAKEALDRDTDTVRRCIVHAAAVLEQIGRRPGSADGQAAIHKGGLAPWQVRRLKAYIDANLAERITMHDLAALVQLSTSHLSRAFKRTFGTAPYAFVLRRRMEQAQQLMLTTKLPLCQIALECGLSDQAQFSRLFHRMMGTSPKEWRRFATAQSVTVPAV
jgi:AraC family transcriptional regulator